MAGDIADLVVKSGNIVLAEIADPALAETGKDAVVADDLAVKAEVAGTADLPGRLTRDVSLGIPRRLKRAAQDRACRRIVPFRPS